MLKIRCIYLLGALLCSYHVGFSQSSERDRDTVVTVSKDKYRVVTNRFFDNWFIDGGFGAQIMLADHDKQMQTKDRITEALEFNLGKRFTPGIAVRAGYTGYKVRGVTHNSWYSDHAHSTGEVYQDVKNPSDLGKLEVQEFKYHHIHGDVMFNITQLIGGYKENKFYNLSPYAGLGWAWVNQEPKSREPSLNLGIHNSFRVSSAVDINLDFRGSLFKDRFDGEMGERNEEGIIAATAGITYNFAPRTWRKERIIEITSYDDAELELLRNRVHQLAADNGSLKQQLAASTHQSITEVKVQNNVLIAPILITFPINKSIVSNEARVNLSYFAQAIKNGQSNIVYNIAGYADKGTGNPQINERLSRERAEAIFNVLVREFGVPASQLTTTHYGGVDNMFYDDPRLSRAVIVIGR